MYIMNYIDRNALPQARIQGIEADVGLKGVEYNIVLSLTFIGYISMQSRHPSKPTIPDVVQLTAALVPSNMILGKLRPSLYLSACMIAWGIVSGASGAAHSFASLAATRFFLGITEVWTTCLLKSFSLSWKFLITYYSFIHPGPILPRRSFSVFWVVHTKGTWSTTRNFLLRCDACRCLWRPLCRRNSCRLREQ